MNDKKGVIFDMDGTVWDSSANVAKAWTVKVHEAGYTDKVVTREDIQSVMGKPMDVIADTLFTYTEKGPERDTLRSSCENYENAYLREHGGTLYDGVLETWAKLKEMGYHIYIVSNCQEGYIESFHKASCRAQRPYRRMLRWRHPERLRCNDQGRPSVHPREIRIR